jgi:hypothetical protein
MRFSIWSSFALLAIGCGSDKLEWSSYRHVCAGQPESRAAAYTKGPLSPLITFEKRFTEFRKTRGPATEWTSPTDVSKYQLVACVEAVSSNAFETCRYEGGRSLQLFDATYKLSIREAKTGTVLAESTVEKKNATRTCTLVRSFAGKSEGEFPDYQAELRALAAPLVTGQ